MYTTTSEFIYPVELPMLDGDVIKIQTQIDLTEERILKSVLGDVIYAEWLADLDGNGTPQSQKFIDFLDGVKPSPYLYQRDDDVEWIENSDLDPELHRVIGAVKTGQIAYRGLRPSFITFIWRDYVVANSLLPTGSGNRQTKAENSTAPTFGQNQALTIPNYNHGVGLYDEVITWFSNQLTKTEVVTLVTDNADNTYTFDVASSLYLSVGDEVDYNGSVHIVTVVTATSWKADLGSIGLSLPLTDSVWHPFDADDWSPTRIETINHIGF